MRILTFNVHGVLTQSLVTALRLLGHELWLPVGGPEDWKNRKLGAVEGSLDWTGGAMGVGPGAIHDMPFDAVLIPGHDVQRDVLRWVWPAQEAHGARLIFFCGNELPHYRWDLAQNVMAADRASYEYAQARQMHSISYYPWFDFEQFPFAGTSDVPIIRTYIYNYHKRFKKDFEAIERMIAKSPGLALEHVDGTDHQAVPGFMRDSMLTAHFKPKDGYGYSIIESLASGRPVFMPRKYVTGKTLENWVIDGQSAILFNQEEEGLEKLNYFVRNRDYRHELQVNCSKVVKARIDNDRQTAALGAFLENLRDQPPKSVSSRLLDLWKRH